MTKQLLCKKEIYYKKCIHDFTFARVFLNQYLLKLSLDKRNAKKTSNFLPKSHEIHSFEIDNFPVYNVLRACFTSAKEIIAIMLL